LSGEGDVRVCVPISLPQDERQYHEVVGCEGVV